jgi:bacillithiol system protein YtxJ
MDAIQKIETLEELEDLLAASQSGPVWILKHSLICPLSRMAWDAFGAFASAEGDNQDARFAFIPIQRARPVSAALAERTGVRHESPQVLLLFRGETLWHGSHLDIDEKQLAVAARQLETLTA